MRQNRITEKKSAPTVMQGIFQGHANDVEKEKRNTYKESSRGERKHGTMPKKFLNRLGLVTPRGKHTEKGRDYKNSRKKLQ